MASGKKENTNNIEQLFEGIADPVILHLLDSKKGPGLIILCNQKALEMTGYTREEISQMTIANLGHPESGLKDNEMSQRLQSGSSVLFERIVVRKDKTYFPVEVHAQVINYNGQRMVLSLLRDISSRKKVEEETHLHLMFEKIVSNISSRFLNMPDHLIDKGIEKTLKEVSEFIGAIRARIFLLTEQSNTLNISHEWCADDTLCQKYKMGTFQLAGFRYFSSRLRKLEDIAYDRLNEIPPEAGEEREWFEENGFHPIFYIPIISENKLVGTLGFTGEANRNHKWPRQYGHLLRYIATVFYSALKRKELSRKLRLAQFTLDHYSECIYWMEADDTMVFDVNPAVTKTLGYTRDEMLGMKLYDFDSKFNPDKIAVLFKKLKKVRNIVLESVHRKKNGEKFPVEVLANLIEFEGNTFVVAFARDITARKKAAEELQKSEKEYRKIFENVVDIFYEASLDGELLNVTPSVEKITKYKQKDLIGQKMEIFYYDPSVREPLLKALHQKGEVHDFELEVKDIDGSPVPCSLNTKLIFDENGKPDRIVGSLTDIRHRKKAEKEINQLSTALHQSPVSVIITDPETRILYVNNSFVQFSGMDPDFLNGKTPMEITRGQVGLHDYNDLWTDVKKGEVWKKEIEYTKRDGTNVWLSITVSPVFDDENKISNYVGIIEEITERKLAESDLRQAKEDAEKSDHLKSAFLANMSHEIRTPMNAILGFSSLLREEGLDDKQSEYYIDIINSKGRDLLRIISDIIDISRIEAGDLYIKLEPVKIFPFLRGIYNEFREDSQVKSRANLQFRLELPDPAKKVIVNTDPSRLKQVFVNLIQNGLKFTPDGFVAVGFELDDSKNVSFFVRDSGIGIPPEKKKIIFERFRQIDDSHTREYGGTGLGLAICKNLLNLMGSELSLESAQGQGSEFRFSMKYILTQDPDPESDTNDTEAVFTDLDLRDKKILIAEDDGSSYLYLESLLKRYSPEIFWAKNGKQAVDLLQKHKEIDLVLMDIRMPKMNGLEATRLIRQKHSDLPIIAQTAYAQVTDKKLALESGCSDYLSKPVSAVELTALLSKYLSNSE